ncbi:hypothetical protein LIT38_02805 [Bacillus sp. CMF12]|uniref:hypothetical protein n=1 Tax=Bacillus sp. CMF12 TaxID=2884834 RepID=UPI002079FADA|nr:hypothetical protein [Bacillus sp. CMF12]USK50416.1 hypothetical protein LIT38_02805 [Bacillus sp. CMF12]
MSERLHIFRIDYISIQQLFQTAEDNTDKASGPNAGNATKKAERTYFSAIRT